MVPRLVRVPLEQVGGAAVVDHEEGRGWGVVGAEALADEEVAEGFFNVGVGAVVVLAGARRAAAAATAGVPFGQF